MPLRFSTILPAVFLLIDAACSPAQPELKPPTLSFDLQSEYHRGVAEIYLSKGTGKDGWGAVQGLLGVLVGRRATPDDRRAMVAMIEIDSDRIAPDDGPRVMKDVSVHLIEPLARDRATDELIQLLATGVVQSGVSGPLVGWLHALRLDGQLPEGVDILFKAYDRADGQRKAVLAELIEIEFSHVLRDNRKIEPKPSPDTVVRWARDWYATNADLVLPNSDTWISGPDDTISAPVLMSFRAWMDEQFRSAVSGSRGGPYIPLPLLAPWLGDSAEADPVFAAEHRYWQEQFDEHTPLKFAVSIVEPTDGRSNSFTSERLACDLRIASDKLTAVIPAVFRRESWYAVHFAGEAWTDINVYPWVDQGPSVLLRHFAGQAAAAKRVQAALNAGALQNPGSSPLPLQIKVYPTPEQLAVFVSPTAPADLTAFSRPGQSLKIVVNEATTDAEILERLANAHAMRQPKPEPPGDAGRPQ